MTPTPGLEFVDRASGEISSIKDSDLLDGVGLSPGYLPRNPAADPIQTDAESARDGELPVAGIVIEQ